MNFGFIERFSLSLLSFDSVNIMFSDCRVPPQRLVSHSQRVSASSDEQVVYASQKTCFFLFFFFKHPICWHWMVVHVGIASYCTPYNTATANTTLTLFRIFILKGFGGRRILVLHTLVPDLNTFHRNGPFPKAPQGLFFDPRLHRVVQGVAGHLRRSVRPGSCPSLSPLRV